MGFYDDRILPSLLDRMMRNSAELDDLRTEVLATARGRVLEIGFGTGLNASHYPSQVDHVLGLDANPGVERLARKRIGATSIPIEFQLGTGERLPFDDGAFETVVTTLVLCSVSDVERVLAEIRRVLGTAGRYLLLEHGLADRANIQAWQRRLCRLNQAILGGCRLDRPMLEVVTRAGFRFESVKQFYMQGAARYAGFITLGCAKKA